jgi:hypothetical protein
MKSRERRGTDCPGTLHLKTDPGARERLVGVGVVGVQVGVPLPEDPHPLEPVHLVPAGKFLVESLVILRDLRPAPSQLLLGLRPALATGPDVRGRSTLVVRDPPVPSPCHWSRLPRRWGSVA